MTTPTPAPTAAAFDDEHLRERDGKLRLSAYYFHFSPTGCVEVDRVLAAVAVAGKRHHNTTGWVDDNDGQDVGGPGSCADMIQQAANAAAASFKAQAHRLAPGGGAA